METKPDYWKWQYHITRKWQPPKGYNKLRIAGFAITLASWGNDGSNIRPSAATVAGAAGVDRPAAVRLRGTVVKLGLFRVTGRTLPVPGIPILEITMPPNPDDRCADFNGPCAKDPWGEKCVHCGRRMAS